LQLLKPLRQQSTQQKLQRQLLKRIESLESSLQMLTSLVAV
jgi:hypothetical protein